VTVADKLMNPQHFGSDPADIWIQIWTNVVIHPGSNPGSLLVEILALL